MYVKAERNTIMKNNEEIILKAKSGDQEAITQIYNENVNKVYFLCLKFLKKSDDANDITQDTFVKVFTSLDQLKNPSALSSWILTIAANLCKNHLKKSNRFIASDEDDETIFNIEETDDAFIPEQSADNAETRRLVMEIIDRLPDGQRMAIILFYYNEMSIKEIAEVMECTENAVKLRLNHARQTIKEEVLKLEEKGTKLYGVPVIPLLGSIFHYEAINTVPPTIAASNASLLSQSTQVSTNARTAAASAKAAAGGKVMTKITKIIIAALAAVVVAGGAITAVVIANNNNNSTQTQGLVKNNSSDKDESSKKDDESSAEPSSKIESSEPSSEAPSSHEPQSEPSSENSEEEAKKLKAEEEELAKSVKVQIISSNVTTRENMSNFGKEEICTAVVYMVSIPGSKDSVSDTFGYRKSIKFFDKNGEAFDIVNNAYNLNDGSYISLINLPGEVSVDDINVKLYSSDTENLYEVGEFKRRDAELTYASGKVSAGDIVRINGNPFLYAGIASTEGGGSMNDEYQTEEIKWYYYFISLSSKEERFFTEDAFTVNTSGTASVPKPKYPIKNEILIDDEKTLSVIGGTKDNRLEGLTLHVTMTMPLGLSFEEYDPYNDDVKPYMQGLTIEYTDSDPKYSFYF